MKQKNVIYDVPFNSAHTLRCYRQEQLDNGNRHSSLLFQVPCHTINNSKIVNKLATEFFLS